MRIPARHSPWPTHAGEMGALIRAHGWARTPLGPIRRWSTGLKTLVELVLAQQMPTALLWGPELVQIYNDGCRDLLADLHPHSLGRSARELAGQLWHYDAAAYERAQQGETVVLPDRCFTVHRQGRDEEAWFAVCYVTARSADSSSIGIFVTAFETTVRMRAKVQRAEREKSYQLLFDSISEGLCVLEAVHGPEQPSDYRFVTANAAFAAQSGVADVVGQTVRGAVPAEAQEWISICDDVLRTKTARRFECRLEAQARYLDLYVFPIDDPTRERIAVILHDITPRKRTEMALRESEARLSALVEGIPHFIWSAHDDGLRSWSSPQWTRFTGLSDGESRGRGWLEAVHPDDRAGVLEAWKRAPESQHFEADFRMRRAEDGRYRWFQVRAMPVRNEQGRILEWLGTSTDVDDLRQLQETQKIMVAELQHRTRNLIMIVQSIARQTIESSDSLATFAVRFRGRLAALARVQRLLTRTGTARIDLGTLLRLELDALGANQLSSHIHIDGPEVPLETSTVQTLALAIHELATNARKYGALSSHAGELEVTWRVDDSDVQRPHLSLAWIEKCAVPARFSRRALRRGYGRELIEHALPCTLNAATSYVVGADGVRCTIDIPLEERRSAQSAPTRGDRVMG